MTCSGFGLSPLADFAEGFLCDGLLRGVAAGFAAEAGYCDEGTDVAECVA